MERFLENIIEAERVLRTADHMAYVTFPLVKDKRLLLKILEEIKNSIVLGINAILQYDYIFKRVSLYKEPKLNFKTFVEKCAPRCGINSKEIQSIRELFEFIEKHRESPFEFMRNDKVVILSSTLQPKTLTVEKIKEFLSIAKEILKKIRKSLTKNF